VTCSRPLAASAAVGAESAVVAGNWEFSEAPEERPYGIDSGFRDPSGNPIRLTQVREMAAV
jgi:hypothetical protein